MTVALQVITGVHVGSDGGFVSGRVARATPVAGQFIDHLTVDATVLSSPISAVDGTWSLTLICGVVYDVKIDRWAVQTIRVTDDATLDFSWYLEQSLELVNGGSQIPSSLTPAMVTALSHKLTRPLSAPAGKQLTFDADGDVVASSYDVGAAGGFELPTPPDLIGGWLYTPIAGVWQWMELVLVGGSLPTAQDGTAAAVGAEVTSQTGTAAAIGAGVAAATSSELASQTGTASATGTGATTATGSAATSEAGAATPSGSGAVTAVGSEGSAEAGTATSFVLSPGTVLATGAEATAEAGTVSATGTGTTSATGTQAASEYGTATASATSSGSAAATGSEGTSTAGTATATGSGITAATGAQGSAEVGTATASGGGGGATITENFSTQVPATQAATSPWLTASATWDGWTVSNQGPAMQDNGAKISWSTSYSNAPYGLTIWPAYNTDPDTSDVTEVSGFKVVKTWTGPFAAGTFTINYRVVNASNGMTGATMDVNGTSVTLTKDGGWHTATVSLGAADSITLTIQNDPATALPPANSYFFIDQISFA